ncbi:kinase-like domain-containing protein [Gigaspora rosea]|uniref:Kinase-like domain-containing protein n=1 Tax=Gigaspora rosea TaxID=44941 RepID=A0A397U9I5_9GLOM|nr:kinase-like domain-containing protein [Gigaspora rosea]
MIITDFGLSKSLNNSSKSVTSKVYGIWEYADPQYLKSPFTYKRNKFSDIYSLGVLFWELSSGVPPFRALKTVHIIKGDREIPIEGTPIDFKNLYEAAWNGEPNSRSDIKEICKKLELMQLEPVYKDLFKGLRMEYASFENKTEIGEGSFGVMHKAYSKDKKQIVALKTLSDCDENSLCNLVRKILKPKHITWFFST